MIFYFCSVRPRRSAYYNFIKFIRQQMTNSSKSPLTLFP